MVTFYLLYGYCTFREREREWERERECERECRRDRVEETEIDREIIIFFCVAN